MGVADLIVSNQYSPAGPISESVLVHVLQTEKNSTPRVSTNALRVIIGIPVFLGDVVVGKKHQYFCIVYLNCCNLHIENITNLVGIVYLLVLVYHEQCWRWTEGLESGEGYPQRLP